MSQAEQRQREQEEFDRIAPLDMEYNSLWNWFWVYAWAVGPALIFGWESPRATAGCLIIGGLMAIVVRTRFHRFYENDPKWRPFYLKWKLGPSAVG
jgi:hypothetical protein